MTDPFQHFVDAQAPVYEQALSELRRGQKASHWMWFIFPQIAGLGQSEMSQRYALASIEQAHAYLSHSLLGARLRNCTAVVAQIQGRTAEQIFGRPDDMKFRSSMTLFHLAVPDDPLFTEALDTYFDGPDSATLRLAAAEPAS